MHLNDISILMNFLACMNVWWWLLFVNDIFYFLMSWIYNVPQGDHVTFLNIYKGFHQSGKSSQWCYKNFLNYQALVCIHDITIHSFIQIFVVIPLLDAQAFYYNICCPWLLQKKVVDIRGQLLRLMKRLGIPLKSCDRDMQVRCFN